MFVCETCHDKVAPRCWLCKVSGWLMMSKGKCENCQKIDDCYDCHSY